MQIDLNFPNGTVDGQCESVTWRSEVGEPLLGFAHRSEVRALRLFARTLQRSLRAEDLVSRFGGEEFVVVFPERSAQAAAALERLQEELVLALTAGSVAGFTCSFGVADTSDASGLEELLATADTALFRAKQGGRNRVVLAHAEVG